MFFVKFAAFLNFFIHFRLLNQKIKILKKKINRNVDFQLKLTDADNLITISLEKSLKTKVVFPNNELNLNTGFRYSSK